MCFGADEVETLRARNVDLKKQSTSLATHNQRLAVLNSFVLLSRLLSLLMLCNAIMIRMQLNSPQKSTMLFIVNTHPVRVCLLVFFFHLPIVY